MPKLAKDQNLTIKEARFCLEYVKCYNATRAAIGAGYSRKSAYAQGGQILARPRVRKEIERLLSEYAMSSVEVLACLSDQARGTYQHFLRFTEDGFPVVDFSTDDAQDHLYLVKSLKPKIIHVTEGEGENKKEYEITWMDIELYDAQRALELLAKAYGLFRDVHIHLNMAMLTDEQRELLRKGEDPYHVIVYALNRENDEITDQLANERAQILELKAENIEK